MENTITCINCGSKNPYNATSCIKCGQPLDSNDYQVSAADGVAQHYASPDNLHKTVLDSYENYDNSMNLRKTVVEGCNNQQISSQNKTTIRQSVTNCQCGYPLLEGAEVCPSCKTPIINAGKGKINPYAQPTSAQDSRSTIWRPLHKVADCEPKVQPKCSITLIPENNEGIEPVVRNLEGDKIILNRENTEPANRTITSKIQAEVTNENGKWYIENKSEFHTTFIEVSRRLEILPGDIIVMGDRRFRFDSE